MGERGTRRNDGGGKIRVDKSGKVESWGREMVWEGVLRVGEVDK